MLIVAIVRDLTAMMPGLDEQAAAHFAADSVKAQPQISAAIAHMITETAAGRVKWLEVVVEHVDDSPIQTNKQRDTVAVFQGPLRPAKNHSPTQILGAAVGRSLATSAFARALLYANGMRLIFRVNDSPLTGVQGGKV